MPPRPRAGLQRSSSTRRRRAGRPGSPEVCSRAPRGRRSRNSRRRETGSAARPRSRVRPRSRCVDAPLRLAARAHAAQPGRRRGRARPTCRTTTVLGRITTLVPVGTSSAARASTTEVVSAPNAPRNARALRNACRCAVRSRCDTRYRLANGVSAECEHRGEGKSADGEQDDQSEPQAASTSSDPLAVVGHCRFMRYPSPRTVTTSAGSDGSLRSSFAGVAHARRRAARLPGSRSPRPGRAAAPGSGPAPRCERARRADGTRSS